jgi:hypothetical protein
MEKTFQISFTYFGGLIAFFALSKTAVANAIVNASGIPLGVLAALVILLLNLIYVTLASACIFAILKRGLFILRHSPRSVGSKEPLHVEWEKFVREASLMPARHRLRSLAWNIDNYYMLPLYSLIVISSAGAASYALADGPLRAEIVAAILLLLYVIPAYMFYYTSVLNRECRELLRTRDSADQGEPA